jgi:hypothetical protein
MSAKLVVKSSLVGLFAVLISAIAFPIVRIVVLSLKSNNSENGSIGWDPFRSSPPQWGSLDLVFSASGFIGNIANSSKWRTACVHDHGCFTSITPHARLPKWKRRPLAGQRYYSLYRACFWHLGLRWRCCQEWPSTVAIRFTLMCSFGRS